MSNNTCQIQEISLGMLRSDVMLNNHCCPQVSQCKKFGQAFCCWHQVELNTIAAGFGWLGPASGLIHRSVYVIQNATLSGLLQAFETVNILPLPVYFLHFLFLSVKMCSFLNHYVIVPFVLSIQIVIVAENISTNIIISLEDNSSIKMLLMGLFTDFIWGVRGTVSSLGIRFKVFFVPCWCYGRYNGVTDRVKMIHQ